MNIDNLTAGQRRVILVLAKEWHGAEYLQKIVCGAEERELLSNQNEVSEKEIDDLYSLLRSEGHHYLLEGLYELEIDKRCKVPDRDKHKLFYAATCGRPDLDRC